MPVAGATFLVRVSELRLFLKNYTSPATLLVPSDLLA